MVEFKIVISDPKTGKSYQHELKDDSAKSFLGKKIRDKIKGEIMDMTGYEFEIKGGSDSSGFPMRKDLDGQGRKKIFSVSGVGVKSKIIFTKKGDRKIRRKRDGVKQRKTVCGNTIHEGISQINLMVLKHGSKPLGTEPESSEEKKADATTEAPAKEAPAKEEAKLDEKPVEEKKEEPVEKVKKEPKSEVKEESKVEEKKEEKSEEKIEEKKEEVKAEEKPEEKKE